jgi:hypothetical protein
VAAGAAPPPAAAAGHPQPPIARPLNWIDAVTSQVALAPITEQRLSALRKKPATPLDDASFSGLYKVASMPSLPAYTSTGRPAGAITRGYRHQMGKVQGLFRWINQSAYLVSVPFLMLLLVGVVSDSQSLMAIGATVVVVLNIGRLLAGVANLVVIPFRESPLQGVFFLIPPLTFIYLYQNWQKVRKPVLRILGPIGTIGLVILAYLVAPYLRGEQRQGSIKDQVRSGIESARESIGGKRGSGNDLDLSGDLKKAIREAPGVFKAYKQELEGLGQGPGDSQSGAGRADNPP